MRFLGGSCYVPRSPLVYPSGIIPHYCSSQTLDWSHADTPLVFQDTFQALFDQMPFMNLPCLDRYTSITPNSNAPETGTLLGILSPQKVQQQKLGQKEGTSLSNLEATRDSPQPLSKLKMKCSAVKMGSIVHTSLMVSSDIKD